MRADQCRANLEREQATTEGRLLHERADSGRVERRPDRRVERVTAFSSLALGVGGKADVLEFVGRPARPVLVDYKRGKPKPHRAAEVQLCAQAICLEKKDFGAPVTEGALYYGAICRWIAVPFDDGLRALTVEVARATRDGQNELRHPFLDRTMPLGWVAFALA